MIARTEQEKEGLRKAGVLLASVLRDTAARVAPGVTAKDLDAYAESAIRQGGGIPTFLHYHPEGARSAYPATLCVSVNDEVVHGIPRKDTVFADGDVVSLDLGLSLDGYVVDAATTVIVGKGTDDTRRLVSATKEALGAAVSAVKAGGYIGDIGAAVAAVATKHGLSVVHDLGGHATGKEVHEQPYVPNYGTQGEGEELTEGLILALEPIFTLGKGGIRLDGDGWTYKTRDRSIAAHFECTLIVTKDGAEVVTK